MTLNQIYQGFISYMVGRVALAIETACKRYASKINRDGKLNYADISSIYVDMLDAYVDIDDTRKRKYKLPLLELSLSSNALKRFCTKVREKELDEDDLSTAIEDAKEEIWADETPRYLADDLIEETLYPFLNTDETMGVPVHWIEPINNNEPLPNPAYDEEEAYDAFRANIKRIIPLNENEEYMGIFDFVTARKMCLTECHIEYKD